MKYLRKFATEAEHAAAESVRPEVSYIEETQAVKYSIPLGVYIQHINGALYTSTEWANNRFANSEANGVAVVDMVKSFVINKTSFNKAKWSSDTSIIEDGILSSMDVEIAKTDFEGESNTQILAAKYEGCAADVCQSYTFPNGKNGYLPALGEWFIAYKYIADIASLMAQIGGVELPISVYTSTQSSAAYPWVFITTTGLTNQSYYKTTTANFRAFTTL